MLFYLVHFTQNWYKKSPDLNDKLQNLWKEFK